MAIEKYAEIYHYGFGYIRVDTYSFSHSAKFVKEIPVFVNGNFVKEIETGMPDGVPALYIVLENGTWKEYFTGTPLVNIGKVSTNPLEDRGCIIVERDICCIRLSGSGSTFGRAKGSAESYGYGGNIVIFEYVKSPWKIMEANIFADTISQYSEDEIKNRVASFYELQDRAKQWESKIYWELREIEDTWNQKKVLSTSFLEGKIGTYTRDMVSTQAATTKPLVTATKASTEPAETKKDQGAETAKMLYSVSWWAFVLYSAAMCYLIFFNREYLRYEMNLLLATVAYLVIIGVWAYLGGYNNHGIDVMLVFSEILYGAVSTGIGIAIYEKYLYGGVINGAFEWKMLQLLGTSGDFVVKYMGVSMLLCFAFTLIPGLMGKGRRKHL